MLDWFDDSGNLLPPEQIATRIRSARGISPAEMLAGFLGAALRKQEVFPEELRALVELILEQREPMEKLRGVYQFLLQLRGYNFPNDPAPPFESLLPPANPGPVPA